MGNGMDTVIRWGKWVVALLIGLWQGMPALAQLLVLIMAVDIVLGLMLAAKQGKLSWQVALDGVSKKVVSLLMVGVAALLNPHVQAILQVNLVQAASAFYLVPELTSITRNAALFGVPVFGQFNKVLGLFENMGKAGKEPDVPPASLRDAEGGRE